MLLFFSIYEDFLFSFNRIVCQNFIKHMDTLSMLSREDSESDEHTLSKRACMENEVLQGASARDVRKERFIYVERANSLSKSYIYDHSHSSF